MGVILGLYVGFWRVLGESWEVPGGGLGRSYGEGPAECSARRLKGLGGLSYKRLGGRDVFYFAFRRFERDATATAAKTIRPTKISRT